VTRNSSGIRLITGALCLDFPNRWNDCISANTPSHAYRSASCGNVDPQEKILRPLVDKVRTDGIRSLLIYASGIRYDWELLLLNSVACLLNRPRAKSIGQGFSCMTLNALAFSCTAHDRQGGRGGRGKLD